MITAKGRKFLLHGSSDYAPVIFREHDTASAILTAVKANGRLYQWDSRFSCWNPVYIPWGGSQGDERKCTTDSACHPKCRYDCLFQKTDAYYYSGAGIINLPKGIITGRWSLFDDRNLPPCPLKEYDIYSDADYQDMEYILHELPPLSPMESPYEEENPFGADPKFHKVCTYLPYTHWRIKQILNDDFNAYLVCIRGYKEGRYPGYKQRYNVYLKGSDYLLGTNIHLDTLRSIFAEMDIPLHKPDTVRNKGAELFLDIVRQIKQQQENS